MPWCDIHFEGVGHSLKERCKTARQFIYQLDLQRESVKEYVLGMVGTGTGACPSDGTSVMVEPYGALVGLAIEPCVQMTNCPVGVLLS